jgi:hypothetical protein
MPLLKISADVHIAAQPQAVWAILTDFGSYQSWNPFIVQAQGTASVGQRLALTMLRNGQAAMRFKPTVTVAEPGLTLEWLGRVVVPGLFDGRHRFDLKPVAGGTAVVQSEVFSGLAVRFANGLAEDTTQSFIQLNLALKQRIEDAST